VKKTEEDTDFASNAFHERRKRKRVQAVAKLKPAAIALAVHRIDNSVYFRRLEHEEFALLDALKQGKTCKKQPNKLFATPAFLPTNYQGWFNSGSTTGLLSPGSACPSLSPRPLAPKIAPRKESVPERDGFSASTQKTLQDFFYYLSFGQSPFLLFVRLYWDFS